MEDKMTFNNACDGVFNSIDVHFTSDCDNRCDFCIDKKSLNITDIDIGKMANKIKKYGRDKTIIILGGEPFLYPKKLYQFICMIKPYVKEIFVTTSLPTINLIHEDYCRILKIVDGLNISLHSVEWKLNNKILNAKSNYDRISYIQKLLLDYSGKIRINLNLTKQGINNKKELFYSLGTLEDMGVKNIKINELQNDEKNYISFEKIMKVKLKSPYAYGCQQNIDIVKGVNVILKRSCFVVEKSLKASFIDFFKIIYKAFFYKSNGFFKVLYESGELKNNWR
jgi:molybdenum cofactor biosynthesis enzyme MoaA